MKRSWIGNYGNETFSSFVHAMEGLSPLSMLDLDKDQIAALNDEDDLLNFASLVSVHDLRAKKK